MEKFWKMKKNKTKKKKQRQPLDENRLQVSLRRRRHLTSISNVCSNDELPQVGCEFPFILVFKSWYTDEGPGVSQTDLTKV